MTSALTELRGIVPSLNTPFSADGSIDRASLPRLVDHCVRSGCSGALALAAAGETAHLNAAEWTALAGDLAEASAGRLPLILSLTAPDLAASLARAVTARALAVPALLWQPPAGLDCDGIGDSITRLSEAAGCPIMLQDLDFVGDGLPLDWIERLFARGNGFVSLKIEIENAGPKYSAVLAATGGGLHVAGGWAVRTMTDALARGVHAFIPTGMEPLYVAVDRMWRDGDRAGSQALFGQLAPILEFSNRDLDHSIRFFKRMRQRTGLFASDHVRVTPAAMNPADSAEADRLIALAAALEQDLGRPLND